MQYYKKKEKKERDKSVDLFERIQFSHLNTQNVKKNCDVGSVILQHSAPFHDVVSIALYIYRGS